MHQAQSHATRIQVEQRFPLSLSRSIVSIRDLYETGKNARWEPKKDLPWNDFAAADYSAEALAAARLVWSRRAWIEYTRLSETPAVLIRFCLEQGRESDPKYFLTVRNTEEAWQVESYHRFAALMGGYINRPPQTGEEAIFNQYRHRQALDAEQALDAYFTAYSAVEPGLELALFQACLANARDPLAHAILEKAVQSKERHARFGWLYVAERAQRWSDADREQVAVQVARYLQDIELKGYHCPSLNGASEEAAAAELAAESGLGAITPEQEAALFVDYVAGVRTRLQEHGVALQALTHSTLGTI